MIQFARELANILKNGKIESARLEADLLISHVLNVPRSSLVLLSLKEMGELDKGKIFKLVERRLKGEPMSQILGSQEFYGRSFVVTKDVLTPRSETESLVEEALKEIPKEEKAIVADLGTGSGCIGLTISLERPDAYIKAIDVSKEAIQIARKNREKLQPGENFELICESAENFLKNESKLDVIVANPPYISLTDIDLEESVKMYEPHLALFSEENGNAHIRSWSEMARNSLNKNGVVLFEIGHCQGPSAREIFESNGFTQVEILKDLSGKDRIVKGKT